MSDKEIFNNSSKVSKDQTNKKCLCCPYGYHIALDFLRYNSRINSSIQIPDKNLSLDKIFIYNKRKSFPTDFIDLSSNKDQIAPERCISPSSIQLKKVSDHLNKNIRKVQSLENEVKNIPKLLTEIDHLNKELTKLKTPSKIYADASTSPYVSKNIRPKVDNSISSYCVESKDDSSETSLLSMLQISERSSIDVWSDEGYAGIKPNHYFHENPVLITVNPPLGAPFHDSGTHSQTNSNSSTSEFEEASCKTIRTAIVPNSYKIKNNLQILQNMQAENPVHDKTPRLRGSPRITKIRPKSSPIFDMHDLSVDSNSHSLYKNYDIPKTIECSLYSASDTYAANKSTYVTETHITEEWSIEEIIECRKGKEEFLFNKNRIAKTTKGVRDSHKFKIYHGPMPVKENPRSILKKSELNPYFKERKSITFAGQNAREQNQLKNVQKIPALAVLDEDIETDSYQKPLIEIPKPRCRSCTIQTWSDTPEIINNFAQAEILLKPEQTHHNYVHSSAKPFSYAERPILPFYNLASSDCELDLPGAGEAPFSSSSENCVWDDLDAFKQDEQLPEFENVSVEFVLNCQLFVRSLNHPGRIPLKDVNSALDQIQMLWFEIASKKDSKPNQVLSHIDAMISMGCPVERICNMVNHNGNTCLHYAVCHSNWSVVKVLLDACHSLDVNRFNRGGYTPLMLAAVVQDRPVETSEMTTLTKLVEKAVSSLPSANPQKQSALMLAAMHGFTSFVNLILKKHPVHLEGSDSLAKSIINQRDTDGSTPLMGAVEYNRLDIVKIFLSRKDIDVECRDNDGVTALDIALNRNLDEIASLIYAHQKNKFKLNNVILQRVKEEDLNVEVVKTDLNGNITTKKERKVSPVKKNKNGKKTKNLAK